jgi:hypothetical protein
MATNSRAMLKADSAKAHTEYTRTSDAARAGREKAKGGKSLARGIGKGLGFLAGVAWGGTPLMMAAGAALFGGAYDILDKSEKLKASGGKYSRLLSGKDREFNKALDQYDIQENQKAVIDFGTDYLQGMALQSAGAVDKTKGLLDGIGDKLTYGLSGPPPADYGIALGGSNDYFATGLK